MSARVAAGQGHVLAVVDSLVVDRHPMVAMKLRGGPPGVGEIVSCAKRGQRMPWRAASPCGMRKRTTQVAPISTAVTQHSPSPWAKWPSPAENRAPDGDRQEQPRARG